MKTKKQNYSTLHLANIVSVVGRLLTSDVNPPFSKENAPIKELQQILLLNVFDFLIESGYYNPEEILFLFQQRVDETTTGIIKK